MQYFAQDEANRLDPTQTVYETMEADSPVGMVPMIRNILGGFLFSGDDIYKTRRRAVGRRAHAAGRRAHAAAPGEHAAARRADQPPRPRLEGRAARSARGLRRHADLRLARPLLRRPARHEGHRGRPRRASRSTRAPTSSSSGAGRSGPRRRRPPAARPPDARRDRTSPSGPGTPSRRERREPSARKPPARRPPTPTYEEKKKADAEARRAAARRRRPQAAIADLEGRIAERERAIKELEAQMAPRLLRRPGRCRSGRRQHISAHVGSRRPDEPVGSPPGTAEAVRLSTSVTIL